MFQITPLSEKNSAPGLLFFTKEHGGPRWNVSICVCSLPAFRVHLNKTPSCFVFLRDEQLRSVTPFRNIFKCFLSASLPVGAAVVNKVPSSFRGSRPLNKPTPDPSKIISGRLNRNWIADKLEGTVISSVSGNNGIGLMFFENIFCRYKLKYLWMQ